ADKTIVAKRVPADDRGVGADARATPDRRLAKLILARNVGPGVIHVGEDGARPAKYVVREFDAVIDRNVVLNLATVSDLDVRTDHHVLPDRAVLAYDRAREYVAKVPDFGAAPDHDAIIDIARLVDQDAGKARILAHLAHLRIAF